MALTQMSPSAVSLLAACCNALSSRQNERRPATASEAVDACRRRAFCSRQPVGQNERHCSIRTARSQGCVLREERADRQARPGANQRIGQDGLD